jgi:hypothetical protein
MLLGQSRVCDGTCERPVIKFVTASIQHTICGFAYQVRLVLLVAVFWSKTYWFCCRLCLALPHADNPTFMLVSGISAPSEMCVSV